MIFPFLTYNTLRTKFSTLFVSVLLFLISYLLCFCKYMDGIIYPRSSNALHMINFE